ncbi:MAG: FKBP-type peptidyl-prolyl cis-trans isomerase [Moraxellaceae bacterium]
MSDALVIEDLVEGTGRECVKGALILTHYTGWLDDGTLFDSSHSRGRPFECVIGTGRVIKGWDQGLMGMRVGGKRRLFVPAHLAYGERQVGAHIAPNSNLHFEIELLDVRTRDD